MPPGARTEVRGAFSAQHVVFLQQRLSVSSSGGDGLLRHRGLLGSRPPGGGNLDAAGRGRTPSGFVDRKVCSRPDPGERVLGSSFCHFVKVAIFAVKRFMS
jgi:hypothetical protein